MTWAKLMSDAATLKAHGIAPFDYYVDDWAGFIWFEQFLLSENPTRLPAARPRPDLLHQRPGGKSHGGLETGG